MAINLIQDFIKAIYQFMATGEAILAAPNIREQDERKATHNAIYCQQIKKFIIAGGAIKPVQGVFSNLYRHEENRNDHWKA